MTNVWQETTEPESLRQNGTWRQHAIIILPILVIYLALACYRLDHQSLWLDEMLSVWDSASFELLLKKGQGPLHYILLHMWRHLGTSEFAMRTLSVLVGAVAVGLFYATSVSLFTRRVAALGTLLFATSPFLIWYSQEVRYIILMMATALLTMYTLHRLDARSRAGAWLVYGLSVLLALFAFVTNVFLLLAQGLYLLWSPRRRALLRPWLVCMVLVSLPFGWWASGVYFSRLVEVETTATGQQQVSVDPQQLSRGDAAQEFTPMMLPYTFFAFSAGFSQGPTVRELHVSRSLDTILPHAPTLVGLGLLFGGLFVVGLTAIWRRPDARRFLIVWMVVPLAGVLSMTIITDLGYNVRYVAMTFPAFVLILTAGIVRFRRPAVQLLLVVAVLGSHGLSLANYYFDPQYARADARAATRYLETAVQPQDVVLVVGTLTPLKYYAGDSLPLVSSGNLRHLERPVAEHVQELSGGSKRIWLVEIRPWQQDPQGKVKALLDKAYSLVEQKQLPGVDIHAYQPPQQRSSVIK